MKKLECEGVHEMKTSELIKRVMEIEGVDDYGQSEEMLCFYASEQNGIVAYASRINKFEISTGYGNFKKLPSFAQELLLDLLCQYAMTPLEEREEPEKYKLKHKLIRVNGYLNYVGDDKELIFSTDTETGDIRTSFTIQEWEVLTEQTWEDLLLQFKAIEV